MQYDFKYADLLNDDVFKLVFGQESSKDVMIEFLNHVITDRRIVDLDFMDIAGDRLSEMRLLVEGAITLFEDETGCLNRLATEAGQEDARSAFNDIGAALYCMRRHVIHLQAAHHKEAMRNSNPDA